MWRMPRVGRGDDVADAAFGQEVAQAAVAGLAPGAVGHHPASGDAVAGKPRQGTLDEGDHRRRTLVCELLAIRQPRVIVDDRVEVVVPERVGLLAIAAAAVAGHGVPRPREARIALD